MDADRTEELVQQVNVVHESGGRLRVRGGDTKAFYGNASPTDAILELAGHSGILAYDPSELVITARGGTPLMEVETALAENGQMLPFEPPYFGGGNTESTIGGAVASGISGPGRPWRGAVRDVMLGVRLLNGRGQVLKFGGQVMKNVAGYDLSRLMAGAMGTLGVLLEVSIRVQPLPRVERTLQLEKDTDASRMLLRDLRSQPSVLTGAVYTLDTLYLRLAGHDAVLDAFRQEQGGEWLQGGPEFWHELRNHQLKFFSGDAPLWRLSVSPDTPPFSFADEWLVDWGGAQHWIRTRFDASEIRRAAEEAGGHAELFRGELPGVQAFHPLNDVPRRLHENLKAVFDPDGVFNPDRMYDGI